MTAIADGSAKILAFWFERVGPDHWWRRSAETDAAIARDFEALWEEWRGRAPEDFLGSARDALAAVILFDQFSRNMFRGRAKAFSTDALALSIAEAALGRGYDQALDKDARSFLYMPFQHSEDLADQDRALALFHALGIANSIEYAEKHREMIRRFGRFPARNAALGRANRPGEAAAIAGSKDW